MSLSLEKEFIFHQKSMLKYFLLLLIFCLGKWWHQTATAEDLLFLLAPTDVLVSASLGDAGVWKAGEGYLHERFSMIINASCAGFNFFALSFLMLGWLLLNRWNTWWAVLPALLLAWPLTILANTSRILTISLLKSSSPASLSAGTWHELQGAFVYFTILVIAAIVLRKVLGENDTELTSEPTPKTLNPPAK
ncbi:MAG: exosortase K [Lewinella sp.]